MASEAVRLLAISGITSLFLKKQFVRIVVLAIAIYCFLMFPFLVFAGRNHYIDGSIIDNFLYIRKHDEIEIDSPLITFFGMRIFCSVCIILRGKNLMRRKMYNGVIGGKAVEDKTCWNLKYYEHIYKKPRKNCAIKFLRYRPSGVDIRGAF